MSEKKTEASVKAVKNDIKDAKEGKNSTSHRVATIIGIVLCVILIPILVINITLIIKSYTGNETDVPTVGGWAPLIVQTGSMEPEIMTGDLIFVKQIEPDQVKKGDIIAFFDPEGNGISILTHRVFEVNEDGSFTTKGDANVSEDRMPVSGDKLVGIYRFRLAGMGNVAMFMQTTAGLIVCVIVPLVLLIGWDIFRRRRYEKKNQLDTDALLAELEELKAAKAAKESDTAEVRIDEDDAPKQSDTAEVRIDEDEAPKQSDTTKVPLDEDETEQSGGDQSDPE